MSELTDVGAGYENNGGCALPPEGYWCSRGPGHGGPCAARSIGFGNDPESKEKRAFFAAYYAQWVDRRRWIFNPMMKPGDPESAWQAWIRQGRP